MWAGRNDRIIPSIWAAPCGAGWPPTMASASRG
jgi:hypothetical protein